MKYYIIAGEASGDLHGSNLMKALKQLDNDAIFRYYGGDLMQAEGGTLVKHYRDGDFMGFVEVVANLRTILRNIANCKKDIEAFQPDKLILIDYPGFNLRIAKWAKVKGLTIVYYISPQVWAWNVKRVHSIKKIVDKMLVILPFEQAFYQKYDYETTFVGHPLLDEIRKRQPNPSFYTQHQLDSAKRIIALLPGSRGQEINSLLPTMLEMVSHFPNYQFVLAGAPSIPVARYQAMIEAFQKENKEAIEVKIIQNKTYDILENADAAIVASGTATLETALFEVPQVVCYRGNWLSYQIAKRVIRGNYISLVNLIMDKLVVQELIQADFNEAHLKIAVGRILEDNHRKQIMNDYKTLKQKLGDGGASERAAQAIWSL